jgi:putative ABC transport system permease protein
MNTYFKLAWRNLWKQKSFTALNILGLTVAFASAILLGLAALFELSYDAFHTNRKDVYKVYTSRQKGDGMVLETSHPVPFTPALKSEVAGIKYISRLATNRTPMKYGDKELMLNSSFVDEDYLNMFSFPVAKGNKTPLKSTNQVVLTEEAAKRVFGDEDAVGKMVQLTIDESSAPYTVSAVLKDVPTASTFGFDILIRFDNYEHFKKDAEKWNSKSHDVYVQLSHEVVPTAFERSTQSFSSLHYKNEIESAIRDGAKPDANGQYQQIKLLPLADLHYTTFANATLTTTRVFPYMILTLSFLILFIACVNFINMSIGLSAGRLREIGMRKTLGAEKKQLFFQFWGESALVFGMAAILGFGLAYLLFPEFKILFKTRATFDLIQNPSILTGFAVVFILITLAAGGYPPFLMSKIGTLQSLKGKLQTISNNTLRNSLIVVQFAIAILLISSTLVIWRQLNYMETQPTGFNKEHVIAFPIGGISDDRAAMQRFRNALQDKPNILSITASDNILGRGKDGSGYSSKLGFDYKGHEVNTNMLVVDHDYVETLELKLVAGRSFNRQFARDSIAVVINETLAKKLEEHDPLSIALNLGNDSINKHQVIGVVKDYNFHSFRKKIEPILIVMNDWRFNVAYVKVAPQNISQSFDLVKNAWHTIDPTAEFQGSFLDENLQRLYEREKTLSSLITWGSIVAIMISCLGLFAVALLMVAKRRKEIGIRKVVGASTTSLTFLLSKDFLKLVGIALVIATPIAYWLMDKWLQDYAYRITLSWWIFALAGILAVVIAFLTVSFQTVKAALANPVKALRTE